MKGLKKTLVSHQFIHPLSPDALSDIDIVPQLSRSKSQESSSSKTKEAKAAAAAAAAPPPPPPNSAKPLPQPNNTVANLGHLSSTNNSHIPSTNGSNISTRSVASSTSGGPAVPQRGYVTQDRAAPAPPIVVVSPDSSSEPIERRSLGDGPATPPRANTLNRLRTGPKDTIPIVGKPPRKQRSSRFVITEKVEIEKLPPFLGTFQVIRRGLQYNLPFVNQKRLLTNDHNCSLENCTNARFSSTSMTPTLSSKESRSRRRHYMKC